MADFTIDAKSIKQFAARCKLASPELQKAFVKSLNPAGDVIAGGVKRRASAFHRNGGGTTRIADSVKVRRRGTRVKVIAGGTAAPEAAPINNLGKGGTFRHPVFGNYDVWRPQAAHPFMEPDAAETAEAGVLIAEAVLTAFKEI